MAGQDDDKRFDLVVYVAGTSIGGRRTVRTVETLAARDGVRLDLHVVDVIAEARRAEADRIIATPTVVRWSPLPMVRLVGDVSDPGQADEIASLLFDI